MRNKLLGAASVLGLGAAFALSAIGPSTGATAGAHAKQLSGDAIHFKLNRSQGVIAANCLANASANVTVKPGGVAETMTIHAHNLPANREFDVFVIQVPNAPFGVSWYQGDLESDQWGNATGTYRGRFNIESFMVAPNVAPAAQVFNGDGAQNVASPPIHTYHVGIWFGSPDAAAAAGCPTTVTPFNGEHNAGIQALASTGFDDLRGPLRRLS